MNENRFVVWLKALWASVVAFVKNDYKNDRG